MGRSACSACVLVAVLVVTGYGQAWAQAQGGESIGKVGASSLTGPYRWQSDTIYRFRIYKKIQMTRHFAGEKKTTRISEIKGVLVLKIQSVRPNGVAVCEMRFDDPKVELPPRLVFEEETNKTGEDGKPLILGALMNCLKAVKWTAHLDPSGRVKIVKRVPEDPRQWLEEMADKGKWKRRWLPKLVAFLKDSLRLWGAREDGELFPVQGNSQWKSAEVGAGSDADNKENEAIANSSNPPTSKKNELKSPSLSFEALRPARILVDKKQLKEDNTREQWRMRRQLRSGVKPGMKIKVPNLATKESKKKRGRPVLIEIGAVKGNGSALFDKQLGMLDTFAEQFDSAMNVSCGNRKLSQRVQVTYQLERLAPKRRGAPQLDPDQQ